MDKLPTIPTPLGTRWREFRYQFVPFLTFGAIVAAVIVMWRDYVVPPSVLAEVETVTASVISLQPGILTSLSVERFQRVTNGQEIGRMVVIETNVLDALITATTADLRVKQAQVRTDELRNRQNYERERLSYLEQKVQNNINRSLLARAAADFLRASNMWLAAKPSLISEADYDRAKEAYERYATQVREMDQFLAEKERILPALLMDTTAMQKTLEADIVAQEGKIRSINQSVVLTAPMDGTVSIVSHHPGERVVAGAPIITITPLKSDRIIAYVRQPINQQPRLNDRVQVRRQTLQREVAFGRVVQVGTQLEPITPSLLTVFGVRKSSDLGLPFLVKLDDPAALALAPGERVDLLVNPPARLTRN